MRARSFALALVLQAFSAAAYADAPHGPSSRSGFSHDFRARAHTPEHVQVGVNFGLLQPIVFRGFNAAAEVRYGRLVLEYSHGAFLRYDAVPSFGLTPSDRRAGLEVRSPWTTGLGVSVLLIDELYLGIETKIHRYDVGGPDDQDFHYRTVSIGPVLGYRLFLFRGLHLNAYVRYWPNVWTDLPGGERAVSGGEVHQAKNLNFFGNISIGWAFEVACPRARCRVPSPDGGAATSGSEAE